MVTAHNVTTKKDIVKPLQFVEEADTITTPASYGVTPTSSPAFTAAGLNTEITINPDIVHQDVDVLGSEDIVDAVKTGELYTFTTRFNPTDSVLINYGLAASGGGSGSIDASLSFVYSEKLDGTENFTFFKGCRPTSTTCSLERGTWNVDMTWVCKEITTPATSHGLTTPTFASIPTASPLTHTDAGSDPFSWNSVATAERRFSTTVTRDMSVLSVNGETTITYAKPSSRRIEFSVDAFVKNTTLIADFKSKTARAATYSFSTSPSKTLTYTNCVITSYSSARSATTTDAFVESITARAEGLSIA